MNKLRLVRIAGLLFALLGLSVYGRATFPFVTLQDCLNNPQRYDRTTITIGTETVVQGFTAEGFTIRQMDRVVPVIGDTSGLRIGEFIHLVAVFRQSGELELKRAYIAKYRRSKMVISLISVTVVLWFFFRYFTLRGLQIVRRNGYA